MPDLRDLSIDQLHDLARLRDVPGHTEMARDALLDALDARPSDEVAQWLGKPRQEIYEAAKARGIGGLLDMEKADMIRALTEEG